jgi:hypothetical protein
VYTKQPQGSPCGVGYGQVMDRTVGRRAKTSHISDITEIHDCFWIS